MQPWLAGSVVFTTSGAILVLEILAGRLLAPYVGIRLETYTAIIGTVLAGISFGTWMGGQLADRYDPRKLIGPSLVAGGALSVASLPVVRALGEVGGGPGAVIALAFAGFFAPAAVLSAAHPAVVKLALCDLSDTGRVVGRLSALATAGAIVGTFTAGFVLVAAAATSTVIVATGGGLVVIGLVLWWALARPPAATLAAASLLAGVVTGAGSFATAPCDAETRYHCARVVTDPDRPGGRSLYLDILRHSYVDLDDPAHLEARYVKGLVDIIDVMEPGDAPLDAFHVGGGGFTLPRYLNATRPGSEHLVAEVDPGLVTLARDKLGLRTGPELRVAIGDARLITRALPGDRFDIAVGDAFGDLAVPWHLATTEFVADLHRVLRPGGTYLLNLIDYPPHRFARGEGATLLEHFEHLAVVAPAPYLNGSDGGNFVLAASDRPFDKAAIEALIAQRSGIEEVLTGAAAEAFVESGRALTDDYAPVDQWLAGSGTRR